MKYLWLLFVVAVADASIRWLPAATSEEPSGMPAGQMIMTVMVISFLAAHAAVCCLTRKLNSEAFNHVHVAGGLRVASKTWKDLVMLWTKDSRTWGALAQGAVMMLGGGHHHHDHQQHRQHWHHVIIIISSIIVIMLIIIIVIIIIVMTVVLARIMIWFAWLLFTSYGFARFCVLESTLRLAFPQATPRGRLLQAGDCRSRFVDYCASASVPSVRRVFHNDFAASHLLCGSLGASSQPSLSFEISSLGSNPTRSLKKCACSTTPRTTTPSVQTTSPLSIPGVEAVFTGLVGM